MNVPVPVAYQPHSPERFADERRHFETMHQHRSAICKSAGEFLAQTFPHAATQAVDLTEAVLGLVDYLCTDAIAEIDRQEAVHKFNEENARRYNNDPARMDTLGSKLIEARFALEEAEAGIAKMPEEMRGMAKMAIPMLRSNIERLEEEITWMQSQQGGGQ